MSILDRILGRAPSAGPQITASATPRSPANQSRIDDLPAVALSATVTPPPRPAAEGMIRVYDQFGRKVEVGREAWRRDVLLPNLAAHRDDPDALYELIIGALNDDFEADLLESARHLAEHDPQPRRGALTLGVVLLQRREFAAAREVLERAVQRHGPDTYLLANLARAHAATGDEEGALRLIWQALGLEPNEETSLAWLIAVTQVKGGQQAVAAACLRASRLPGSWRAQLYLARFALESGNVAEATRLYEEALARADPVSADLLLQLTGDLGNRGQAELLVKLALPRFDVAAHGFPVGNNLLRAFVDLGRFADARRLLEQLYALQRPEWREALMQWEERLDDAQKRYGEVHTPLELVVIKLDQPIWARGLLGFDALLPAKSATAPRVHFVCGSGEAEDHAEGKVISQPTNELGRLTRALPMFLMEEICLRTNARASFLLPWMKQGGFIVSAKPWTTAFLPPDHVPPDLIVFLHVDARAAPWLLKVTIQNMQRQAPPVVFERVFGPATAAEDVTALLEDVMSRLTILLALRREESPALPSPPPSLLPGYLTAIEQALAIGLAARQQAGSESFLHQERSILDHLFDVALHGGELLRPRLLLINALENQSRRRKDMVLEYLDRLELLQEKHALPPGGAADLVARGVAAVAARTRS